MYEMRLASKYIVDNLALRTRMRFTALNERNISSGWFRRSVESLLNELALSKSISEED